ncbi:putative sodium/phosphate symporter [Xylaria intraflava]|nr:putative sodium/phosphate symporter [Xylaria intraflava]
MLFGLVFEILGAVTVGARTADTIKNGIIPVQSFRGDAGVQLLAFTCALVAAASWVMWCTKHSTHVSSTYSLISAVAGVGVAVAGADKVQWGWNGGQGLGAIFAGLGLAPIISGGFAAIIFMLIKLVVHIRRSPIPWAVWTSPAFFFIVGTILTLSIVYKGSPSLGLSTAKPAYWLAGVILGSGAALGLLSAIFFLPYVHTIIIKRDQSLQWWEFIKGPLLFSRPYAEDAEQARVRDYAVVQKADADQPSTSSQLRGESGNGSSPEEKQMVADELQQKNYRQLLAEGEAKHRAALCKRRGPIGWAMRTLRDNPMGAGEIYEVKNIRTFLIRLPATIVAALLYGFYYDIHRAQHGVHGTPDGKRMESVYAHAEKYPNEVEHLYSFVQILTACTASFAHGANDIGNSVGPWAVIYSAWSTGDALESKAPVPVWQLGVLGLTISFGLFTYGYNIMKVMGNKITYHSPSRGTSMELGAAITILLFSQFKLPVSTSMCICGATVGVGLCNGTIKAVNWHRILLLLTGWILTIPIAGTLGGVLMGILINAPHFPTTTS